MTFKLRLLITFLFAATTAAMENGAFSLESVWKNSAGTRTLLRARGGEAHVDKLPHWIERNQKYHDDLLAAFNSFPSKMLDQDDTVRPAMQRYLAKLTECSNSESKTISSGATTILETLSQIKVDDRSAQGIINEFSRMLPILMTAYRGAVTNLTTIIGSELVNNVNDNLSDAERDFRQYVDDFNAGDENGLKKDIDYDAVMKSVRGLTNTINNVTSLNGNQLSTDLPDALVVLGLVLDHVLICTNGLSSSSKAVLHNQNCARNQSC